jgi:hypothetical protein
VEAFIKEKQNLINEGYYLEKKIQELKNELDNKNRKIIKLELSVKVNGEILQDRNR